MRKIVQLNFPSEHGIDTKLWVEVSSIEKDPIKEDHVIIKASKPIALSVDLDGVKPFLALQWSLPERHIEQWLVGEIDVDKIKAEEAKAASLAEATKLRDERRKKRAERKAEEPTQEETEDLETPD